MARAGLAIIRPMMTQRDSRRALAWVPRPVRAIGWNALQWVKHETPALLMLHVGGELPARTFVADGYALRRWQPGDDSGWIALLNQSGAFGGWDEQRLARETAGLLRESQYFALSGSKLVAGAGVLERPLREHSALEIGWVVRDPDYKDKHLGLRVTEAALIHAREVAGARPVYLYTDDHRLTAIEMYVDLGFVPDLHSHRSYARRWERVFRELALRRRTSGLAKPAPGGGED